MKKLLFFATALLVLASCNNKDNALNNAPEGTPFKKGQQITLTVGTGNNANQAAPRKVAGIDNTTDGQIEFTWEAGDQILVKVGTESAVFTLSSEPGFNYGEFVGTMPADGSAFDIQFPIEAPNLSAQVYTAEKTIPADKMLFKATNCTLGNTATLYAQNAMVQLNLYGSQNPLDKLTLKTKDDDGNEATYQLMWEGTKTIGATLTTATPFYMVVPAGSYAFEVGVVWTNAKSESEVLCSFSTSAAKTLTAGNCLNMPVKFVPTYVDLGLTSGIKWATCNVGADAPEGFGEYFAWGETSRRYNYHTCWQYYFDSNDGTNFTKYYNGGGKTRLEMADDAAHSYWGSDWRVPTSEEFNELLAICTYTYDYNTDRVGVIATAASGNSIFIPAAGYYGAGDAENLHVPNEYGHYWSANLTTDQSNHVYGLDFGWGGIEVKTLQRSDGSPIRAVFVQN